MSNNELTSRIENFLDIQAYLQNICYALENGARLMFQEHRRVDERRDIRYTNAYTIATLFPDENPVIALKRELKNLTAENYIRTVKDLRFPARSEMREFGKTYNGADVYVKIRVELLTNAFGHTVFVMSFHFAEREFTTEIFPYKGK